MFCLVKHFLQQMWPQSVEYGSSIFVTQRGQFGTYLKFLLFFSTSSFFALISFLKDSSGIFRFSTTDSRCFWSMTLDSRIMRLTVSCKLSNLSPSKDSHSSLSSSRTSSFSSVEARPSVLVLANRVLTELPLEGGLESSSSIGGGNIINQGTVSALLTRFRRCGPADVSAAPEHKIIYVILLPHVLLYVLTIQNF